MPSPRSHNNETSLDHQWCQYPTPYRCYCRVCSSNALSLPPKDSSASYPAQRHTARPGVVAQVIHSYPFPPTTGPAQRHTSGTARPFPEYRVDAAKADQQKGSIVQLHQPPVPFLPQREAQDYVHALPLSVHALPMLSLF